MFAPALKIVGKSLQMFLSWTEDVYVLCSKVIFRAYFICASSNVFANLFKALHMFLSCSVDVHELRVYPLKYFPIFFCILNLVILCALILSTCIDSGYLVCATLLTV